VSRAHLSSRKPHVIRAWQVTGVQQTDIYTHYPCIYVNNFSYNSVAQAEERYNFLKQQGKRARLSFVDKGFEDAFWMLHTVKRTTELDAATLAARDKALARPTDTVLRFLREAKCPLSMRQIMAKGSLSQELTTIGLTSLRAQGIIRRLEVPLGLSNLWLPKVLYEIIPESERVTVPQAE
jgi:hypothetical protein